MIDKLTLKQEKQLIEYREQCRAWGLCCEPADKNKAEKNISYLYSGIKKPPPSYFWWVDSPLAANLILNIFFANLRDNLGNILWENLWNNLVSNLWENLGNNLRDNLRENLESNLESDLRDILESNLGNNLRDNLRDNLWKNLRDNLESNLGDNLWKNLGKNLRKNLRKNLGNILWENLQDNLRDNLWNNLGNNLRDNLRDILESNLESNLWENLESNLGNILRDNLQDNLGNKKLEIYHTIFWGQMDFSWIAFYRSPEKYLNVKYEKEDSKLLSCWENIAQSCGWFWTYENICFVSNRPKFIRMKDYKLHADGKPALQFRDGYALWFLNGVAVSKEIAETPAGELNPQLAITEKNAEVRREIIRKIGVEICVSKLGARSIEKKDNYELLDFGAVFEDKRYRPYLKMRNPSIRTYHIEGVSPECKTIEQALNFRKPEALRNLPVSEKHGCDWFQQGDVVIWPKGAKSLKPYPSTLT